MVRRVDRDARAREIHHATRRLLLANGYRDLTLRALADELGGSLTLVTHYFPTHDELMTAHLEWQLDEFDVELERLETGESGRARLETFVEWFLPNDDESWLEERSRIMLLVQVPRDASWLGPYLDRVEERMIELLRERLAVLVPPEHLDLSIDIVRMALNGITLSAIEHRESWPPARQLSVILRVIDALPLREGIDDAARP